MPKVSFGSLRRSLSTLRSLPEAHRRLLIEAIARLAVARIAVAFVPFRFIARRLGVAEGEPSLQPVDDPSKLREISWAIQTVSRRAPWRCKCLEQGVAAKMMLRRRGLPSTLYLGVARRDAELEAHAWLRSGTFIVTGGGDLTRFAVVSTFADKGSR
jgi:hypothetical protein